MQREIPDGKDPLSRVKNYVIIALLAVLVFGGVNSYLSARSGSGSGSGSGPGCGGCVTADYATGAVAASSEEQLRQLALEYYAANYAGNTAVVAEVRDFGCHQEIYIFKDGQLVKRLSYWRGELYEMPGV